MRGVISRFFPHRGYGFILDGSGVDRFFHLSSLISANEIVGGEPVEFIPAKTERGPMAVQVQVLGGRRPAYVSFGDIRLKTTSIMEYYMCSESVNEPVAMVGERTDTEEVLGVAAGIASGLAGLIDLAARGLRNIHGGLQGIEATEDIWLDYPVLCVVTFQGKEYRFSGRTKKFDIRAKFQELDRLFLIT